MSRQVYCNSLWRGELTIATAHATPLGQVGACWVELLYAIVLVVCYIDVIPWIDGNRLRLLELPVPTALCAPCAEKMAGIVKGHNTMVFCVGHIKHPLATYSHIAGVSKLSRSVCVL